MKSTARCPTKQSSSPKWGFAKQHAVWAIEGSHSVDEASLYALHTGSLEGHYFLATGALRELSEQQLVDCTGALGAFGCIALIQENRLERQSENSFSVPLGNSGCEGGQMTLAFEYIKQNNGIDSEDDYTYDGADDVCWVNASKRVVATLDSFVKVHHKHKALYLAYHQSPETLDCHHSVYFECC